MKTNLKKLTALILTIAMMMSLCSVQLFAYSGKLAGLGYNDIVVYSNDGTTTSGYTSGQFQELLSDGTTKLPGKGMHQGYEFAFKTNTDEDSEYHGVFSAKIKADASNIANEHSLLIQLLKDSNAPIVMMFGNDNLVGGPIDTSKWSYQLSNLDSYSKPYVNDRWYTIAIAVKKNQTADLYVDGELLGNVGSSIMPDSTVGNFNLKLMVCDVNTNNTDVPSFYIDDIVWSHTFENSFVAECGSTVVSPGDVTKIKFSQPVVNPSEVTATIYDCSTGEEVSGGSYTFVNEYINVTLPDGLTKGNEYRIEISNVKGSLGQPLVNDNIYFNCAISSGTEEVVLVDEDFSSYVGGTYQGFSTGNYVAPNGWLLNNRWENSQTNNYILPETDGEHGTVMKIGKDAFDWGTPAAYMALPKKITSGIVEISYDIKPIKQRSKLQDNVNDSANIFMYLYPNAIDPSANTLKENGTSGSQAQYYASFGTVAISGIVGTSLGFTNGKNVIDSSVVKVNERVANWNGSVELTNGTETSPQWYTVKQIIDLDKDTIKGYIDDELVYESADAIGNLGLGNGIGALSFGLFDQAYEIETYIDNVKVSRTIQGTVGDAEIEFTDSFDTYTTEGRNSFTNQPWSYAPPSWNHAQNWMDQTGTVVMPSEDAERGTGVKLEKIVDTASSRWGGPQLYHALNGVYTSGIIDIEYDLKPVKLTGINDAEVTDEITGKGFDWAPVNSVPTSFGVILYPTIYTGTQLAPNSNDNTMVADRKIIFGIQNKQFASFYNNYAYKIKKDGDSAQIANWYPANYRSDATEGEWYRIKNSVDLDAGITKTYIDGELVAATPLSGMGISQVGGIGFMVDQSAFLSDVNIDNVTVSRSERVTEGGVMQVRFSDYYNTAYGPSAGHTTLTDTISISFWNIPDRSSLSETTITLTNSNTGEIVEYDGDVVDDNVYLMNLSEYLDKNTEYILTLDGVVLNDTVMEPYSQIIKTSENGELVIEPIEMRLNGEIATSGELADGSELHGQVHIINTTGEEQNFVLSMGLYKDKVLYAFDYDEFKLGGDGNEKSYTPAVGYTLTAADASDVTSARIFLWESLSGIKPLQNYKEFTKTSASE